MDANERPWRQDTEGLLLTIRLTPKASRDTLEKAERLADGRSALKARVRAVPEKGDANEALLRLLAKTLSVPRSRLEIISGATARLKTIRLHDAPSSAIERLEASFTSDSND